MFTPTNQVMSTLSIAISNKAKSLIQELQHYHNITSNVYWALGLHVRLGVFLQNKFF